MGSPRKVPLTYRERKVGFKWGLSLKNISFLYIEKTRGLKGIYFYATLYALSCFEPTLNSDIILIDTDTK